MALPLTMDNIPRIADVLGTVARIDGGLARLDLQHDATGRTMVLEVRFDLSLPDSISDHEGAALVSVYATNSFLQLQWCTRFISSTELGEVIFFSKHEGTTSGLVVEREAACSLYANVDDRVFSSDFMDLPPELVMSSVALSMTDTLFDDLG
jgi:hypothetical protein